MAKIHQEITELQAQLTAMEEALQLIQKPPTYRPLDELGFYAFLQQELGKSDDEQARKAKISAAQAALAEGKKVLEAKQNQLSKLEAEAQKHETTLTALAIKINELSASLAGAIGELRTAADAAADSWWQLRGVTCLEDYWAKRGNLPQALVFTGDFVRLQEQKDND